MPIVEPRPGYYTLSEIAYDSVQPLGSFVIYKVVKPQLSNTIVTELPDLPPLCGLVLRTGPEATLVKPGQYIIVEQFAERVQLEPDIFMVRQEDIMAYSETDLSQIFVAYLRYTLP